MPENAPAPRRPHRITGLRRLLLGILGFSSLAIGTTALFVSSKEISVAVLLVIGAVLGTLAIIGILPVRFGMGNFEMDLGVAEAVAEAVGTGSEAERLADQATISLPGHLREETRSRVAEYIAYERSAISAIRRVAPDGATVRIGAMMTDGWRPDATVIQGHQRVFVEVRKTGDGLHRTWRRVLGELALRVPASQAPWLLVLDRQLPANLEAILPAGIVVAEWAGIEDDERLRKSLSAALARSGVRTLREAIGSVLREADRPLTVREITLELNQRALYKPKGADAVSTRQVAARVSTLPHIFVRRSDGTVDLVDKSDR